MRGGRGGAFSRRTLYLSLRDLRVPDVRRETEPGPDAVMQEMQSSTSSPSHLRIAIPPAHWMTRKRCFGSRETMLSTVESGGTSNAM